MNSYTITEAKVKTFYTIRIGPYDMAEIVKAIRENAGLRFNLRHCDTEFSYHYERAADDVAASRELLQHIWSAGGCQHSNTAYFIAHDVLEFDDVDDYGYFDESSDRAVMVVYRYGDRLNAGEPRIHKGTTREPTEDDGGDTLPNAFKMGPPGLKPVTKGGG